MPSSSTLAVIQISTWNLRMHSLWVWTLVGLATGWLAGMAFRGRGFGCITDILLGVAGSLAGGWLFTNFAIMGGDFFYSLAAAAAGAFVVVGLAHLFAGEKGR
jgi:uncharacterized membrane protein YeaQ/YmgE (transglycosylase-associated protein family)